MARNSEPGPWFRMLFDTNINLFTANSFKSTKVNELRSVFPTFWNGSSAYLLYLMEIKPRMFQLVACWIFDTLNLFQDVEIWPL